MYDPMIGQFLSEDPIGFDGLDDNLRRYVHNRVISYVDPDGLQETSAAAAKRDVLTIPIVIIDMTTRPRAGTLSDEILEHANQIFEQCDASLSKRGIIFPGRPAGNENRITFDGRTHTFDGGGWSGTTLKEFLRKNTDRSDVVYVILVDELLGYSARTFGLAYGPGNRDGTAIVLAVDVPPSKFNDTPGRTLAHECGNYFGLEDDRQGRMPGNLMSYGKWPADGFMRGTSLTPEQIRELRLSIERIFKDRER